MKPDIEVADYSATNRTRPASIRIRAALKRRTFLRGALASVVSVVISPLVSGCADSSPFVLPSPNRAEGTPEQTPTRETITTQPTSSSTISEIAPTQPGTPSTSSQQVTAQLSPAAPVSSNKVLLVYFSRAGENYSYGGRTRLNIGNTEVVANMINQLIGCDVYRIAPIESYSDSYMETVQRNVKEQQANARPAIVNPLASIEQYDTVLLGSPIWNVRAPMIMSTFVESFDFKGKAVFPFTTYAVSGLGTTVRDYTAACPGATIGEALAVRGEEEQNAEAAVAAWLRRIKLLN